MTDQPDPAAENLDAAAGEVAEEPVTVGVDFVCAPHIAADIRTRLDIYDYGIG